tara:strand:+ start:11092 stop:11556 length:465 start_codon:yes stop_codon:yes gene_type:complete
MYGIEESLQDYDELLRKVNKAKFSSDALNKLYETHHVTTDTALLIYLLTDIRSLFLYMNKYFNKMFYTHSDLLQNTYIFSNLMKKNILAPPPITYLDGNKRLESYLTLCNVTVNRYKNKCKNTRIVMIINIYKSLGFKIEIPCELKIKILKYLY